MAGGLLNLIAIGNQNIILNGNPTKSFLKLNIQNIQILDYKNLEWNNKDKQIFI